MGLPRISKLPTTKIKGAPSGVSIGRGIKTPSLPIQMKLGSMKTPKLRSGL